MTVTPVEMPARLSPSSVTTFLQCPLKFKYSRIDKIKEPPSEAQVLGNIVHDALEGLFKLPSGERNLRAARALMVDQWHASWQQVCADDLGLGAHGQHMLRWNAWVCVENYFALEDPSTVHPTGVEEEVFDAIAGVPMLGYMDRWIADGDGVIISDYKTGKVSRPPYDQEKKLQLWIYTDLVQQLKGMPVKRAELIYLKGKGTRVEYTPSAEDLDYMRQVVRNVWDDLRHACETNQFETKKTRLCDWCYYKSSCPAWQRK